MLCDITSELSSPFMKAACNAKPYVLRYLYSPLIRWQKEEKRLRELQGSQGEVMRNMRRASKGEQLYLDKTLEKNIILQNYISIEIKVGGPT